MRLVAFHYTDEYRQDRPSIEDAEYYNVIAQEFREVFPQAVTGSGQRLADGSEILQVDTYPAMIHALGASRLFFGLGLPAAGSLVFVVFFSGIFSLLMMVI